MQKNPYICVHVYVCYFQEVVSILCPLAVIQLTTDFILLQYFSRDWDFKGFQVTLHLC